MGLQWIDGRLRAEQCIKQSKVHYKSLQECVEQQIAVPELAICEVIRVGVALVGMIWDSKDPETQWPPALIG